MPRKPNQTPAQELALEVKRVQTRWHRRLLAAQRGLAKLTEEEKDALDLL